MWTRAMRLVAAHMSHEHIFQIVAGKRFQTCRRQGPTLVSSGFPMGAFSPLAVTRAPVARPQQLKCWTAPTCRPRPPWGRGVTSPHYREPDSVTLLPFWKARLLLLEGVGNAEWNVLVCHRLSTEWANGHPFTRFQNPWTSLPSSPSTFASSAFVRRLVLD